MRESGDERRFAEKLLLGDGPEVSSGEVLGWGARLQVVLSVQPSQPQQLTVAVKRVSTKGQCKGAGHDPWCGQDLVRGDKRFHLGDILSVKQKAIPQPEPVSHQSTCILGFVLFRHFLLCLSAWDLVLYPICKYPRIAMMIPGPDNTSTNYIQVFFLKLEFLYINHIS